MSNEPLDRIPALRSDRCRCWLHRDEAMSTCSPGHSAQSSDKASTLRNAGHYVADSCPYHDEYYADCPYCLRCDDPDCRFNREPAPS